MINISHLDEALVIGVKDVCKKLDIGISKSGLELVIEHSNDLVVLKNGHQLVIKITKKSDVFLGLRIYKEHINELSFEVVMPKKVKHLTFMLDASRNAVAKVSTVKSLLLHLAIFGYDALQLYTEDTFEMDDEPYFGYLRGAYQKTEIAEIEKYAESLGLELIPCIQTLAHLNAITRYREYGHLFDTLDILLVNEEKTYEFIEKMIKTSSENFKSRFINIGMDEAYMLGRGKYLDKHGYEKRFDIMVKHLNRVLQICEKYGLKPMMWSDMFFAAGWGDYYAKNNKVPKELLDKVPANVSLVYWDYYHTDKAHYIQMIEKHQMFNNPIIFAGGSWKWIGFTPDNRFSLLANKASMAACIEKQIEKVIITSWGDNGAEASVFSVLPSMFYNGMAKYGHLEIDEAFKNVFKLVTKVEFDDFMLVDSANQLTKKPHDKSTANKHLLYNDILLGLLDTSVEPNYPQIYTKHYNKMKKRVNDYGDYKYIFETQLALLDVIRKKVLIGVNLRKAYQEKNYDDLMLSVQDMKKVLKTIQVFQNTFSNQWHKDNKAFGYEIQDLRIGGIKSRIETAILKVSDYLEDKTDVIEELEVTLLDYYGNREKHEKSNTIAEFRYKPVVSVGVNV